MQLDLGRGQEFGPVDEAVIVGVALVPQPGDHFVGKLGEDLRIPRAEVRQGGYLRRSLMPDGLLESLPDDTVVDLFAYLKTLL